MNVKMLTKNEIIRFEKVDYPFQKFEIVKSANNIFLNARYKSFVKYYGVENNGKVILIAPTRIAMRSNSCYIVGTKEYFDIVDCLYCSKDVLELADAYKTFFDALKKEGISAVYWDWLPDDTLTKDALLRLGQTKSIKFVFEPIYNVKIDLGGVLEYQTYFQKLSKSVRQNIRTAYNRLERDQHSIRLNYYYGKDSDKTKVKNGLKLYLKDKTKDTGTKAFRIGYISAFFTT